MHQRQDGTASPKTNEKPISPDTLIQGKNRLPRVSAMEEQKWWNSGSYATNTTRGALSNLTPENRGDMNTLRHYPWYLRSTTLRTWAIVLPEVLRGIGGLDSRLGGYKRQSILTSSSSPSSPFHLKNLRSLKNHRKTKVSNNKPTPPSSATHMHSFFLIPFHPACHSHHAHQHMTKTSCSSISSFRFLLSPLVPWSPYST
jgi:hypothetical protein